MSQRPWALLHMSRIPTSSTGSSALMTSRAACVVNEWYLSKGKKLWNLRPLRLQVWSSFSSWSHHRVELLGNCQVSVTSIQQLMFDGDIWSWSVSCRAGYGNLDNCVYWYEFWSTYSSKSTTFCLQPLDIWSVLNLARIHIEFVPCSQLYLAYPLVF